MPSSLRIDVNESAWPLVIIRVEPLSTPTVAGAKKFGAAIDQLLARSERFASVIDGRGVDVMPSAVVRKALAEELRRQREALARFCVAEAMLVNSQLVRGLITAVHWITSPRHPVRCFVREEAALQWCGDLLRSEHWRNSCSGVESSAQRF